MPSPIDFSKIYVDEKKGERIIHISNLDLLALSAQAASEKHAEEIVIKDLRGILDIVDHFFICSAPSQRQVHAIAQHLVHELARINVHPQHTEGYPDSNWILLDYGETVFHVFQTEVRRHYDLEGLWSEATTVSLAPEEAESYAVGPSKVSQLMAS